MSNKYSKGNGTNRHSVAGRTRAQEVEPMLLNLLARIHRDGGQYVNEHGLDKAVLDAEAKIGQWLILQDSVDL